MLVARLYDAITAHTERLCLADWRRSAVSSLGGSVIEIGSGTGLNLEHYSNDVERLVLAEPDRHMRAQLQRRIDTTVPKLPVELCDQPAEALPFPDASFDHVVSTLVLCSVVDPERALTEAFRLLRPGGKLIVIEHIQADVGSARQRWQARLNPIWTRCSGGCHLNRDPRATIAALKFETEHAALTDMRGAPAFLRTVLRARYTKP